MPTPRRITTGLTALSIASVLAYGAVAATLYARQREILFRPETARPALAAAGVPALREATLRTESGLDLLAWWLPPAAGAPTLLYFHGNGGSLIHRAGRLRQFAAAGLGVLMPEYPGYGGNPGAPSERALFETADAASDFLAAQGVPDGRIAVYGESLGTGVAAFLAAKRRYGALVLESPFTSVTALARERYGFLPVALLVRDRFDTLSRIGGIGSPLLVALGEQDQLVPPAMGRAVLAAAPPPKQLWRAERGGHEDLAEHGLIEAVETFVRAAIGMRPASR